MSFAISLFDLVNLSVGTPDAGSVNFNALHTLLHAVVRHLDIQNVTAEWTGENGGRKPPDPSQQMPLPRGKPGPYHHMEDKLRQIEKQIAAFETLPSATDLLARTKSGTSPVSDMWQLMQLHRKVQASEDGVSKVNPPFGRMHHLADLVTPSAFICSCKSMLERKHYTALVVAKPIVGYLVGYSERKAVIISSFEQ